jgi:NADH-quinone oxidoreductase subunit J
MDWFSSTWTHALATLTGAAGMWLMLPRGRAGGRLLGALLGAVSLGLFASRLPVIHGWLDHGTFWLLAGVTVIAAAGTVTFRNPVYCAVWFGLSLIGTAGLFLFQGSQFLAVATIVVYAGAILVTLLFVLMLANPSGRAPYDRISWEAPLSATIGIVMVGILTIVLARSLEGRTKPPPRQILQEEHVAKIGAELFSRHLLAVELAGTLLLIALVGAVAIILHSRPAKGVHESP